MRRSVTTTPPKPSFSVFRAVSPEAKAVTVTVNGPSITVTCGGKSLTVTDTQGQTATTAGYQMTETAVSIDNVTIKTLT